MNLPLQLQLQLKQWHDRWANGVDPINIADYFDELFSTVLFAYKLTLPIVNSGRRDRSNVTFYTMYMYMRNI